MCTPALARQPRDLRHRLRDQLTEIDHRRIQCRGARDEAAHLQNVVHQAGFMPRAEVDGLDAPPRRLRRERLVEQHVRPEQDRCQRRAQLVAERGQKLILLPAGQLGGGTLRLQAGALGRLALGLLATLVELDEHRHLGSEDQRLERHPEIVDRSGGVTLQHLGRVALHRGEEDDRDLRVVAPGAYSPRELDTAHAGHMNVEHHHRVIPAADLL
jgi:hypothetical protein